MTKNEQGQLTQQEFFRIFLISVQNSLTINQRVSAVESGVEDNTDTLDNEEEAAHPVEEDGHLEDWNKSSVAPSVTDIVSKSSVAPSVTDFKTLFDDSTEKSVKRSGFCKRISVARLSQSVIGQQ